MCCSIVFRTTTPQPWPRAWYSIADVARLFLRTTPAGPRRFIVPWTSGFASIHRLLRHRPPTQGIRSRNRARIHDILPSEMNACSLRWTLTLRWCPPRHDVSGDQIIDPHSLLRHSSGGLASRLRLDGRTKAMRKARILQNAAEMHEHFLGESGALAKSK
jgi:hypothetical protein